MEIYPRVGAGGLDAGFAPRWPGKMIGMGGDELLAIYLRDHMAGARMGVELARRMQRRNADNSYGPGLAEICAEIESDRQVLSDLMERLEVRPNPVKEGLALAGERLGRLKLNGRLRDSSPLSLVVELEGLMMGVTGKLELWRSLRSVANGDKRFEGTDLKRMAARAESQRKRLERMHDAAAAEALAAKPEA